MKETSVLDWKQVREVFEQALEQPLKDRHLFVQKACVGNDRLFGEVESLLSSHDLADSFLETPIVARIAEEAEPSASQLSPGQLLAHYQIVDSIGAGGMGEVYLARDTRLDRNVAIKLLRVGLLPQAQARERLLREAKAAATLEHPNICPVYEISEADGFNFIVMQYIVGTTLDDIMADKGLDAAATLDIASQILDGLALAHSRGIIHRDIKPANIIVSEKGEAKILDFGLAKFIEAETSTDAASRLESTGGVMGTVPYMSPEQLSSGGVDARTDVFSFGSLLFEMFTGVAAFNRGRNDETIFAILNEGPNWSLVSPALRPLLERCLAKDQKNRYASAGKVAEALIAARKQVRMERPIGSRLPNAKRAVAATDQPDAETASYPIAITQAFNFERTTGESNLNYPPAGDSNEGADHFTRSKVRAVDRYLYGDLRTVLIGGLGAIVFSVGLFAYLVYLTSDAADSGNLPDAPRKLYWELSYTDRRKFIQNRVRQVQAMIGDDQRGISNESLNGISKEVDWYISRRDSLSQEPFKDGLRLVYGRASQYVPMVSTEFEKQSIPTAIGIYQAIVESEYRDCLVNDTGPTGIFQFTKFTAEQFGLAAQDRCRVDLSSKAAAAYDSKLRSYFGSELSSWTLAVLSFNQGEDLTRLQIQKLVELGLNERNYWAISENRERFSYYNPTSDQYLRRFFAAAIIGENPEMFGLVTPPLSTIRTRADLKIPSDVNPLVTIPGGSFKMGRGINDGHFDFERPQHLESVDGFRMNKTEVTNIEFADFISATGYKPEGNKSKFLAHWVNGLPLEDDEHKPVRFVNLEDINAFIKWKSQAEGIQYRLPTEKEWEYAARNGGKNNIYPWGDKFDARCANINQTRSEPVAVGTHSCPNAWGIHDLIGNVFEWTASPARPYPGSQVKIAPAGEEQFIIRGGGAFENVFETSMGPNAITSTFRYPVPASRRSSGLGFRLVAPQ